MKRLLAILFVVAVALEPMVFELGQQILEAMHPRRGFYRSLLKSIRRHYTLPFRAKKSNFAIGRYRKKLEQLACLQGFLAGGEEKKMEPLKYTI